MSGHKVLLLFSIVALAPSAQSSTSRVLGAERSGLDDVRAELRAELQAEMALELKAQVAKLVAMFENRLEAVTKKYEQLLAASSSDEKPVQRLSVDNNGVMSKAKPGRRLASGDTHIAVPSLQVHEFPSGHSCANTASGFMRVLPHTGSDVSYKASPDWTASTDDELSLCAISPDWSTSEIQRIPFPLKVVHDANCSSTPTLQLTMSTDIPGKLTVHGTDVGSYMQDAGPYTDPLAWNVHQGFIGAEAGVFGHAWLVRNGDSLNYYNVANSKRPVSYMSTYRGYAVVNRHMHFCLTKNPNLISGGSSCDPSTEPYLWVNNGQDNMDDGYRTACPDSSYTNGFAEIWHGSASMTGAGSDHPADDNLFTDSDSGDLLTITIEGTTVNFYHSKYSLGASVPFRTCTNVPSGPYYAKVMLYAPGTWQPLPSLKYSA